MKYLSVCSGIEAATVAWHPLGWKPVAFSEIEKFPSQVLAHHYPDVPNVGDMTKFEEWKLNDSIGLLVGGTPCQSFSVAGLRKGLADPRGNLMLTYLAIAQRYQPKWLVWENVPGVLSSNGGRDFGTFLSALGQCGYGFAYRVLDAQYFGVAQRRRRVFVVGYLGDWKRAAAVLFESESLSGHPAPSRKARENIASTITSGAGSGGANDMTPMVASGKATIGTLMANAGTKLWQGNQEAFSGDYSILQPTYALVGNTIGRKPENGGNGNGWSEEISYTLTKTDVHGVAQPIEFSTKQQSLNCSENLANSLSANDYKEPQAVAQPMAYAFDSLNSNSMKSKNPISGCNQVEISKTLDTQRGLDPSCNQGGVAVAQQMAVRRLTPVECERLQGFPDGYTDIKENTPDGPRYKALGNSMAVPVMRWIGQQIQMVESL